MKSDSDISLTEEEATRGESEDLPRANRSETRPDENDSEGKFDALINFIDSIDSESDEERGRQNPLGKEFRQIDLAKVKDYFESSDEKVKRVDVSFFGL